MARVKTFANNGTLLPGDLNSIEDDYEGAFSVYRNILLTSGREPAANVTGAGVYALTVQGGNNQSLVTSSAGTTLVGWYFDPADYAAANRALKLRVSGILVTNGVAPAVTMTFGVYPLTLVYGASGSAASFTVGTVVAGSTYAVATPGINSTSVGNSGDFTAPSAGFYMLGVNFSGAMATNGWVDVWARLQFRQV